MLAIALEYAAVALNIAFTILIGGERRVGWLFGIVAAVIGVWLYAVLDAWLMGALNLFYAGMGIYGWWGWGHDNDAKQVTHFNWQRHVVLLAIGLAGTGLLVVLMRTLEQPGNYLGMEAFIASFAIVATWMMGRKVLENWFYWMIGDVVAIVYNYLIGYNGYALLNATYVVLAVVGYLRWRKQMTVS